MLLGEPMSIDQAYGLSANMIEHGEICDEVKDAWRNYVMAIVRNYKIGTNFKLIQLSKEERSIQPDPWRPSEASNRYCTECCR